MHKPPLNISFKGWVLITLMTGLGGCASTGSITTPAPEPAIKAPPTSSSRYREPEIAAYRPPVQPALARPQPSKAVQSLLKRARVQQAGGELVAAANTLERALRIQPDNALVWNRLAHVRLEQGRYQQAVSLAAKSNALAGSDAALRADNDELIRRARASR